MKTSKTCLPTIIIVRKNKVFFDMHFLFVYCNKCSINTNKCGIIDIGIFIWPLVNIPYFYYERYMFFEKNNTKQNNTKKYSNHGGYYPKTCAIK